MLTTTQDHTAFAHDVLQIGNGFTFIGHDQGATDVFTQTSPLGFNSFFAASEGHHSFFQDIFGNTVVFDSTKAMLSILHDGPDGFSVEQWTISAAHTVMTSVVGYGGPGVGLFGLVPPPVGIALAGSQPGSLFG